MRNLSRFTLAAATLCCAAGQPVSARSPAEMTEYFCNDVNKPFFTASGAAPGGTRMVNSRPSSMPSSFILPKPAGTFRVFVVGESAAGLLGSGNDAPLKGFLEKMLPGRTAEVINCGMGAYESRRIYGVLEEVLAYEPDLVVIMSGNNENGKEFCPDFRSELARRSRNLRSRLARLSMSEEDAAALAGLALHEKRLRSMARLARKKGVPAVFCTLPANLSDYPPAGEPPLEQRDFAKAMAAFEKNDFPLALERLKANLAAHPREPFSLFYSGRALETLGRLPEAYAAYYKAVKYDTAADRCSEERNAMIRRVAREEGAAAADLESAFHKIAPGGITGGAQLADGVHWFARYKPFVSAVVAGAAGKVLPGAKPSAMEARPAEGRGDDDFGTVLSYSAAYLADGKFCDSPADERAVWALQRLWGMDRVRLEGTLASEDKLRGTLKDGDWSAGLKESVPVWQPALLYDAAEMFRRTGHPAQASRFADEAARRKTGTGREPGPTGDCPALSLLKGRLLFAAGNLPGSRAEWEKAALSPRIKLIMEQMDGPEPGRTPEAAENVKRPRPVSAQSAASKKLSDDAAEELKKGGFGRAKALLLESVADDRDNFEARMDLCFLAWKNGDGPLGEEHCGEAVHLSSFPEKHALLLKDSRAAALYSRGLFYFRIKKRKEGCEDLGKALELAAAQWPSLPEAREQLRKNCAPARGPFPPTTSFPGPSRKRHAP